MPEHNQTHSHGGHACHDEHDNGHGGGHSHDDDLTPALQSSLYKHIDFERIVTLNEAVPGSGKDIVQKPWTQRLSTEKVLESDADEQLLMFVPFTGLIKLHSVLLRADPSPAAPRTLKLFANRDDLDFSSVSDTPATQVLELPSPSLGSTEEPVFEIPVKRALFGNVHSLTLFFEDNYGDNKTRLFYLGFKGSWTELRKEAVVALFEAAPNPRDHKNLVRGGKMGWSGVGGGGDGF